MLVAPPYDVIPEPDLARYRSLSPYNVIRLIRPGTDYEGASKTFEAWIRDGILEPDPPSMYVHEVAFGGRRRLDLIAALRLQPYEDRVVLPHERTHRGPKEDRLALLRATNVSLEPLWFVYEGRLTELGPILKRSVAGTPIIVVTRFSSIKRSARAGSNSRSRTTVAPFHQPSSACTFQPPTWNCGSTCSTTSSWLTPVVRSKERFVQKQFACVSSAPFGLPVVPDV